MSDAWSSAAEAEDSVVEEPSSKAKGKRKVTFALPDPRSSSDSSTPSISSRLLPAGRAISAEARRLELMTDPSEPGPSDLAPRRPKFINYYADPTVSHGPYRLREVEKEELPEIIDIPRLRTPPLIIPDLLASAPGGFATRGGHQRSASSRGSFPTFYGNAEARMLERTLGLPQNETAVWIGETGAARGSGLFCKVQNPLRRILIEEPYVMACDLTLKIKRRLVHYLQYSDVRGMWHKISLQQKRRLKEVFWKLRFIPSTGPLNWYSLHRLRNFLLEYGFQSTSKGQKRVLVFKLASQVNHACQYCANSEFSIDCTSSLMAVHATRELEQGEEVLFHYGRGNLPCCVCKKVTTGEVIGSFKNSFYKGCSKRFWHGDEDIFFTRPTEGEPKPRDLAKQHWQTKKTTWGTRVTRGKDRVKAMAQSASAKSTVVFANPQLEQKFKSPQWAKKLFKKDAVEVGVEPAEEAHIAEPIEGTEQAQAIERNEPEPGLPELPPLPELPALPLPEIPELPEPRQLEPDIPESEPAALESAALDSQQSQAAEPQLVEPRSAEPEQRDIQVEWVEVAEPEQDQAEPDSESDIRSSGSIPEIIITAASPTRRGSQSPHVPPPYSPQAGLLPPQVRGRTGAWQ